MKISRIGAGALAIAAGLVACGEDGTGPEIDGLALDAAVVSADGAILDVEAMRELGIPGLGLRSFMFQPLIGGRPPCPESGGEFDCPPRHHDGMEISHTVTFLDVDGNPQDALDEESTATILVHIEMVGERGREGWSASVERVRDLVVTGLLGNEESRTWNGTGSSTTIRSRHFDDGTARTYEMSSEETIQDVVVPYPRADDAWPLSGTITKRVTVTVVEGDDAGETREITVVVSFDGSQYAQLTVDGETFEIDLAARPGGRPFSGRHQGPMGPHGP